MTEEYRFLQPPVPGQKLVKPADPPMYEGVRDKFEELKKKVLLKLKGNAQLFPLEAVKVIHIASCLEKSAYNQVQKRI